MVNCPGVMSVPGAVNISPGIIENFHLDVVCNWEVKWMTCNHVNFETEAQIQAKIFSVNI